MNLTSFGLKILMGLIFLPISISQAQEVAKDIFVCPPCDQACDDLVFMTAGHCPNCQMPLQLKSTNLTSTSKQDQLDQLLARYDKPDAPGLAIGVIQSGTLTFAKGYGMANLDYNIPNSPDSKFYIGSMAKQFVGAALLQLESEGKLEFHKPIQTYLPDFPTYTETITVDHIIHHTSGIRCTSSMQLIGGINQHFEEYFSADDQYRMICQQKELNFTPGLAYRYSSGGYIILARLIEQISGLSLREYLDQFIFQPLGMKNTFVIDDHQEIVKDRVISYWPDEEGQFKRRSLIFDGKGDGSILTTINDLLLWDRAFYDDSLLGIDQFAGRMYEKGHLSNGEEVNYSMALSTYSLKGHRMISHNGGMLGFSADLVRFPEAKLSIVVLANLGGIYSTGLAEEIAAIYLEKLQDTNVHTHTKPRKEVNNLQILEQRTGKYFFDDLNFWRRISLSEDSLFYDSGNQRFKEYLIPNTPDSYLIGQESDAPQLQFLPSGKIQIINKGQKLIAEKFDDTPPNNLADLSKFIGLYYSQELNTYYRFYEDKQRLLLQIDNNRPITIYPDPIDSRINWNGKHMVWIGYAMVKFKTNKEESISGFHIGDSRIKGIWFEKLNAEN